MGSKKGGRKGLRFTPQDAEVFCNYFAREDGEGEEFCARFPRIVQAVYENRFQDFIRDNPHMLNDIEDFFDGQLLNAGHRPIMFEDYQEIFEYDEDDFALQIAINLSLEMDHHATNQLEKLHEEKKTEEFPDLPVPNPEADPANVIARPIGRARTRGPFKVGLSALPKPDPMVSAEKAAEISKAFGESSRASVVATPTSGEKSSDEETEKNGCNTSDE